MNLNRNTPGAGLSKALGTAAALKGSASKTSLGAAHSAGATTPPKAADTTQARKPAV